MIKMAYVLVILMNNDPVGVAGKLIDSLDECNKNGVQVTNTLELYYPEKKIEFECEVVDKEKSLEKSPKTNSSEINYRPF